MTTIDGQFGGIVVVIFYFVLFIVGPYLGISCVRLGAKLLLRKFWERWYVRRAVDSATIGFAYLLFVMPHFTLSLQDVAKNIMPAADLQHLPWDYSTNELLERVTQLQMLDFFLAHFVQFVICPALIVGFTGYTIARHREQKRMEEVTKIETSEERAGDSIISSQAMEMVGNELKGKGD